jgi:hypothetical protein
MVAKATRRSPAALTKVFHPACNSADASANPAKRGSMRVSARLVLGHRIVEADENPTRKMPRHRQGMRLISQMQYLKKGLCKNFSI